MLCYNQNLCQIFYNLEENYFSHAFSTATDVQLWVNTNQFVKLKLSPSVDDPQNGLFSFKKKKKVYQRLINEQKILYLNSRNLP